MPVACALTHGWIVRRFGDLTIPPRQKLETERLLWNKWKCANHTFLPSKSLRGSFQNFTNYCTLWTTLNVLVPRWTFAPNARVLAYPSGQKTWASRPKTATRGSIRTTGGATAVILHYHWHHVFTSVGYTITESASTSAKGQVNTRITNTGQATFAAVARCDHPQDSYSNQIVVTWETKTDTARMDPPIALSEFMLQKLGIQVCFCPEVRIGKNIFRCHPSFQSDGAMYDWIRADFGGTVYPWCLAAVVVSADESVNANDWLKLVMQRAQFGIIYRKALVEQISCDRAIECYFTMFCGFHQGQLFKNLWRCCPLKSGTKLF